MFGTAFPNPLGAFHSTKNSGDSGLGSEWNRHFPEFHSEILGVPREVGLKFRKIGITGKFRSIRPFLLGPSFSEPGNRNSTWLILTLLMRLSMSSPSEMGWRGGGRATQGNLTVTYIPRENVKILTLCPTPPPPLPLGLDTDGA